LYSGDTRILRRLLSVFEALDEKFEVVIVDAGSVRGAIQKTLYRAADQVVFVLNSDPASLYPSVDRLRRLREILSPNAEFIVADNSGMPGGLSRSLLLREFSRAAGLKREHWVNIGIPYCRIGARWPGSGSTFVSLARGAGREAIESLAGQIGLVEPRAAGNINSVVRFIKGMRPGHQAELTTESGEVPLREKLPSSFRAIPKVARKLLPASVNVSAPETPPLPQMNAETGGLAAALEDESPSSEVKESFELPMGAQSFVEAASDGEGEETLNRAELSPLISRASFQ
ncbi:MAG: hypothetical protein KDD60_00470, partial [Bdellovibrionales bacterium]|nr:hypothetical protein [Bdellovibrionales bacterium]